MFGMSDPNQTLAQMLRYFEEERYEMVEVMASEFTSMLLVTSNGMERRKRSWSKGCEYSQKSYRYETNTN